MTWPTPGSVSMSSFTWRRASSVTSRRLRRPEIATFITGTASRYLPVYPKLLDDPFWASKKEFAGLIQIGLGIWAMGYPGRSAALLVLWVGLGAIIRGIAQIIAAFHVHDAPEAVMA
jgi:hypothetical protein